LAGLTIFVCFVISCFSEDMKVPPEINGLILEAIQRVSSQRLSNTISDLQAFKTRYTWQKQEDVAHYLFDHLRTLGLHVVFDEYHWKGKKWKNVIGTIEGKENLDGVYMVIAHYDSTSEQPEECAPGADDNASGTAALLEIARALQALRAKYTVVFALFSNEEQGHRGSIHFAKMARRRVLDIKGVINLDLIGYNDPIGSLTKRKGLVGAVRLKLKAIRNHLFKLLYPHGIVTVAGRHPNRALVKTTSLLSRQYSNLRINDVVSDDCA